MSTRQICVSTCHKIVSTCHKIVSTRQKSVLTYQILNGQVGDCLRSGNICFGKYMTVHFPLLHTYDKEFK